MIKNGVQINHCYNNNRKLQKRLISISLGLIIINLAIEFFLLAFETRNVIITLQTVLNALALFYLIKKSRFIKTTPFDSIIIIISIFTLAMCLFSSSMVDSFNKTLKFIMPLYFLIIGYKIYPNIESIGRFVERLRIPLLVFVFFIIYFNIFQIGESFYENGFKTGYMTLNAYYTICFAWISILFFKEEKTNLDMFILVLVALIILIILKRTMILLLGISLVVYLFKRANIKHVFILIITGLFIIPLSSVYFGEVIDQSFQSRSSRFQKEYSIENEGRFVENALPFIHMESNPLMYIFGTGEVFNDRDYHIKYIGNDRELHNSFARLFWSGGLFLLISFLILYRKQFKHVKKLKSYNAMKKINTLLIFTLIFILLRFVNEMSSGLTYISFNMLCYLIVGGVIGCVSRLNNSQIPVNM